jgi:hypothetical protein
VEKYFGLRFRFLQSLRVLLRKSVKPFFDALQQAECRQTDHGDLVGFYTKSDGTKHGFLWLHTYKRLDARTTGVNNATDIVGWSTSGFFAKHIESNEGPHDATEVTPGFIPSATPVPGAGFRSRSMACGLWWDRTSIRRANNTNF